jgi:hypothetical protein
MAGEVNDYRCKMAEYKKSSGTLIPGPAEPHASTER